MIVTERDLSLRTSVRLGRHYAIPSGSPQKVAEAFANQVDRKRSDRYVHGLLYVDVLTKESRRQIAETKTIKVKYSSRYDWVDSFAATADIGNEIYSFEEIAPKPKFQTSKSKQRSTRLDLEMRFALYNAKTEKLAFDKQAALKASVGCRGCADCRVAD